MRGRTPGPQSRSWLTRAARTGGADGEGVIRAARPGAASIVYASAKGSNVLDVDGNRYVDLAAGFGALLLGTAHPSLCARSSFSRGACSRRWATFIPSEPKIALMDRLVELHPTQSAQVLFGQSGADAVSAALKTAALHTGRPGVLAFQGAYHGLSYGPLAACGLRASYREPFAEQLNPHVEFRRLPARRSRARSSRWSSARALLAIGADRRGADRAGARSRRVHGAPGRVLARARARPLASAARC